MCTGPSLEQNLFGAWGVTVQLPSPQTRTEPDPTDIPFQNVKPAIRSEICCNWQKVPPLRQNERRRPRLTVPPIDRDITRRCSVFLGHCEKVTALINGQRLERAVELKAIKRLGPRQNLSFGPWRWVIGHPVRVFERDVQAAIGGNSNAFRIPGPTCQRASSAGNERPIFSDLNVRNFVIITLDPCSNQCRTIGHSNQMAAIIRDVDGRNPAKPLGRVTPCKTAKMVGRLVIHCPSHSGQKYRDGQLDCRTFAHCFGKSAIRNSRRFFGAGALGSGGGGLRILFTHCCASAQPSPFGGGS